MDEIIVMHKPVRKTKNDSRIKLVLLAPFPLHTSTNSFNVDVSQQYFLLYNGGRNSINFNISVNNTGQSTIVPAFEISGEAH